VDNGFELVPLPQMDVVRISQNIAENRAPKFLGDMKLYVGNISFNSREQDIYELFSQVGIVGDVALIRDEEGKNRGFGFITMRTKEDGDKAIAVLDGSEVNGRNIAVRESNN
jgi:RNA recognition motif-containing protein